MTFSTTAFSAAPLRPLDPTHRRFVLDAIDGLGPIGNTNMDAGLELAARSLHHSTKEYRSAVVVLSDGHPNVGRSAPEQLAAMAKEMRTRATVSTLGYGAHHDERVLVAIADGGGGTYAYVPDPLVAATKLARAVGAAGETVADEVSLGVTPHEDATIVAIHGGGDVRHTRDGPRIALPTMYRGVRHTLALEMEIGAGREHGRLELATLDLAYRTAARGVIDHGLASVSLEIAREAGPVDPAMHRAYLLALVDGVRSEARALADRGSFVSAAARLDEMVHRIDAAPGFVPDDGSPLAEAREQLVDDKVTMEAAPDPEMLASIYRGQHGRFSAGAGQRETARSGVGRTIDARVSGDVPNAKLVDLEHPGERFRLTASNIVGRSKCCDIVVPSSRVSRRHLGIYAQDGRFVVEDFGSSCGIFVNGKRVTVQELSHGDVLVVGDQRYAFEEDQ